MCGRFALSTSAPDLAALFEIEPDDLDTGGLRLPSYNIAPTTQIAAIDAHGGRRQLRPVRWGLVPSWSKGPAGPPLINARIETVASKPSFRAALARHRILIPASGYFEWSGDRGAKSPYYLSEPGRAVLSFAGIAESWHAPDGSWLASAAIITRAATDSLGMIHDRAPVIVDPDAWTDWLDPQLSDRDHALALVTDQPVLGAHRVSAAVGRVSVNTPELIRPLEAPPQ